LVGIRPDRPGLGIQIGAAFIFLGKYFSKVHRLLHSRNMLLHFKGYPNLKALRRAFRFFPHPKNSLSEQKKGAIQKFKTSSFFDRQFKL
jgi:hypothetical protein